MTREMIAQAIHWDVIFLTFGIINVGAMLPQLVQLVKTRTTDGLEPKMFWIYFMTQTAFSLQGYFRHDATLMYSLGLSAAVSMTIIVLIRSLRKSALTQPEQRSAKARLS
jgi:uncharacterized protein with PQ loop repeat